MHSEPGHEEARSPRAGARRQPAPLLDPVFNERGVIAENYYDLQGLGVLDAARQRYPLPKASPESTVRALFQGVELALVNLNDVVGRAAGDLERGAVSPAVVKMFWARGFHRVLTSLSLVPSRLGGWVGGGTAPGVLRVADSPAYQDYLQTLRRFDGALASCIDSGRVHLRAALAARSLEDPEFNLLHLVRVANHESTIWEGNLAAVPVAVPVPSYAEFVVAQGMRDAVYDRVLKGDTYFTQFRGLHQIPETLGEEANDHCELAILALRADRLQEAAEHLAAANLLAETMVTALPPMADNLATSDYHDIRENLGLTSGSHSVCLRYHLFTDLYEQLWEALATRLTGRPAAELGEAELAAAAQRTAGERLADPRSWLLHLLTTQCLTLRTCVFQWRDQHLNMPRNNLGGDFTKSLTGSADAVRAVKQMRAAARAKDAMLPLVRARGLAVVPPSAPAGEVARYLDSDESLDSRILVATGRVTQERFHEVQERLGFFANRCPFSPPPRREV